jgi:hypothetical protein
MERTVTCTPSEVVVEDLSFAVEVVDCGSATLAGCSPPLFACAFGLLVQDAVNPDCATNDATSSKWESPQLILFIVKICSSGQLSK